MFRCRRRWWRRSTPPTAARPASTSRRARTTPGAYHQPSAVLCDPAALDTLPAEEAAAGYAEVVKTALIAGGEPVGARAPGRRRSAAPRSWAACARSSRVVAEDERDGGRRQVLNLGHTVGHAIEAATGYQRYRHGEAVADRAAGGAAPVRPRGAARRGGRAAGRARAAAAVRRGVGGRRAGAGRARQEARRGAGAVRAGGGARRGDARATTSTRPRCARPSRRCTRHERPHRRPARRQLRRARPAPGGALRRADARGARGADQALRGRARPHRRVLADQPRGRVLRGAAQRDRAPG